MRRKVQPEILKCAIRLFGLQGYAGVTTRALAREAHTYEPLVYTWFGSKENLYIQAVNSVVAQINEQFTDFVLKVFGESGTPTQVQMANAIRIWNTAIPQDSARLLIQVLISDDKLSDTARKPLDQLINVLTKALSQLQPTASDRQRKSHRKFDPRVASRNLVRALLWGKVIERKTAVQDMEETLQQWLIGLPPSS